MKCTNCGKKIQKDSLFCEHCGSKVQAQEVKEEVVNVIPENQYYYPLPRKSNKGLIITIIIMGLVIIACLIVMLILLLGNNNSDSDNLAINGVVNTNTDTNTNNVVDDTPVDDVPISDSKIAILNEDSDQRNRLLLTLKNKNKTTIDVVTEVEFYDEDDKFLGSDKAYLYGFGYNQEAVIRIYNTPTGYAYYKVYFDVDESYYISYVKDMTLTSNNNKADNKIVVQAKNNSDVEIKTVEVVVIFYKNNEVVGYETDYETSISPGRSANLSYYYPYDSSYDTIDFDDYKLYINEAYIYKN